MTLLGPQVPRQENSVRLPGQERPYNPVMDRGEQPTDRRRRGERTDRRAMRYVAEHVHAAPVSKPVERPWRHFLKAEDVRSVGHGEPNHLFEVVATLGRDGVAVEQVPAANEQGGHGAGLV